MPHRQSNSLTSLAVCSLPDLFCDVALSHLTLFQISDVRFLVTQTLNDYFDFFRRFSFYLDVLKLLWVTTQGIVGDLPKSKAEVFFYIYWAYHHAENQSKTISLSLCHLTYQLNISLDYIFDSVFTSFSGRRFSKFSKFLKSDYFEDQQFRIIEQILRSIILPTTIAYFICLLQLGISWHRHGMVLCTLC